MSDSVRTQLFINGAAADASDGGTYDIRNPARPDELVGCAAAAAADDVETAMQAAHGAGAVQGGFHGVGKFSRISWNPGIGNDNRPFLEQGYSSSGFPGAC